MLEYRLQGIENYLDKDNYLCIKGNQKGQLVISSKVISSEFVYLNIEENVYLDILQLGEFCNENVIINIGANSHVNLCVFTDEKGAKNRYEFNLENGAYLMVAYADFSFENKEFDAKINLNGGHSEAIWHLASLAQDHDKKTFNINFNHNQGDTKAKMENYGVCKDFSTLKFIGDALIVKGAKKSSTKQEAKIMVFDKTCHAVASPKLCIYENDVEASHGASEGQINPEHVFYLTSRGIHEEDAKKLITLGYLYPILQYFNDQEIVKKIQDTIVKKV